MCRKIWHGDPDTDGAEVAFFNSSREFVGRPIRRIIGERASDIRDVWLRLNSL